MKTLGLVLCLVAPLTSQARPVTPAPPPALAGAGAFFALSVADLGASVQWYTEKLGLRAVLEVPRQNKTAVAVLEGGGLIVELIQHDDAKPAGDPLLVYGVFKVGVIVEDLTGLMERLRSRQVAIAFGPYPARDGQRANLIVRDNAGNLIQFFQK